MSARTQRVAVAAAAGLVFAAGLALSGMTQPAKVLGFLDVAGDWDPSLALVMAGAIGLHVFAVRWALRRGRPLFDDRLHLPEQSAVDGKLLAGSALFGVGWGLSGYCPGPALVSVGTLGSGALALAVGMVVGIALHDLTSSRKAEPTALTLPEDAASAEE